MEVRMEGDTLRYSFEQLEEDLGLGHEIEFIYQGEKYSITQTDNGWNIMKFYDYDTLQVFNNEKDLLKNARIKSKQLKDIWEDVEVTTIF